LIILDSKYRQFIAKQPEITGMWERFVSEGNLDHCHLPSIIMSSWKRSNEMGVDPYMKELILPVASDFQERLSSKNDLLNVAIPYITKFYKLINLSNFVFSILDENGVILDLIGNKDRIKSLKGEYNISPGITCCEQTMGTTASYLSLFSNVAVQTVGAEHFIRKYHQITDSAAPIHDSYGKIIGAVSLSSQSLESAHPHTLGMITSVADTVSALLRTERTNGKRVSLNETVTKPREAMHMDLDAETAVTNIIGSDSGLLEAIALAKKAATSTSAILLLGESGTGKELFAQVIHNASIMNNGPFISINCAAIPKGLEEAELFGYEEGAFTGAKKGGSVGKFELANGGTLFLDEIGDMPMETQATLLRVLEEKKITRVGGRHSIPVNVKVVAATNRMLREDAMSGRFRLDLFFRLNVFAINLPSLRERKDDIPVLVKHFIKRFTDQSGKHIEGTTLKAMEALCRYDWPGNIRELSNTIERAVYWSDKNLIDVRDLPEEIISSNVNMREVQTIRDYQKDTILGLLNLLGGNKTKVASRLGISRATLYRRLEEYQMM